MMNITKQLILVASFLAMTGGAPAIAADAAGQPASSFGIIDMNRVIKGTEVAKDVFAQMESKRKEYQVSISKEEDALRSAEEAILKKKDSLSKDEFEKKRKEFEENVISGQKLVHNRKRILDQAYNASMGDLRNEAAKIVADIAKEKNYTAVFTQDAVMISTPSLDMTDAVIERMNKKIKKMAIDWNAASAIAEESTGGKKK